MYGKTVSDKALQAGDHAISYSEIENWKKYSPNFSHRKINF